jgi:uncharacterized protein (DUF2062 family)
LTPSSVCVAAGLFLGFFPFLGLTHHNA